MLCGGARGDGGPSPPGPLVELGCAGAGSSLDAAAACTVSLSICEPVGSVAGVTNVTNYKRLIWPGSGADIGLSAAVLRAKWGL
jgi:hypothetical protein